MRSLSVCLGRAVSVVFGSPHKTRQSRYDHHCSNSRPFALAAHCRTLNDFGSLEYPYRADRTKHKPDDCSSPHSWLPSRHTDRNDFFASPVMVVLAAELVNCIETLGPVIAE